MVQEWLFANMMMMMMMMIIMMMMIFNAVSIFTARRFAVILPVAYILSIIAPPLLIVSGVISGYFHATPDEYLY